MLVDLIALVVCVLLVGVVDVYCLLCSLICFNSKDSCFSFSFVYY